MSAQQVQTLTTAIKSTQFGTKRSALAALDLMERHPQTAALFEQGRLSVENVSNPEYVAAMEKTLVERQERTGALPTASARRGRHPISHTRTVATSQPGVYTYRRPHFDTAPVYAEAGGDGLGDLVTLGRMVVGTKRSKEKQRARFAQGLVGSLTGQQARK